MSIYKVNFANLPWEAPIEGLRFKAFQHRSKQIRLVEYSKEMPPHWCQKGHIGFVLEGEMEIEFEDETLVYKSGDGIFIPHGNEHKHKAKVISDTVKVIFVEDV